VRSFVIENALHWLAEYHFDGLRLDATHALEDDSPCHVVRELALRVQESIPNRTVLLIAEDDRNLNTIVKAPDEGGWGLDAVWADDFHHQIRRLSAGDRDGYYQDFSGSVHDLANTVRDGWFYRGQYSQYRGTHRGTDPGGIPLERMVCCIQNHDQIGNRPFGSRLHHEIDAASFRALSAVLLFAPETPLLFMGQEWAASTPFLYFTDHAAELGRLVTEGRRKEFARFAGFSDAAMRSRIPDPQAAATFVTSQLRWNEVDEPAHAGVYRLYRALLALRRCEPAFRGSNAAQVVALDQHSLAIQRRSPTGQTLLLVACVKGRTAVDMGAWPTVDSPGTWRVVLTTEDEAFVAPDEPDQGTAQRRVSTATGAVTFHRPGAVIFKLDPAVDVSSST
jgi:maltooligosyltrehalose trehalohydrolase